MQEIRALDISRETVADLLDVRRNLPESIGVSDQEFGWAVRHALRKAKMTGKGESQLPFLLPDVIREMVISREMNAVTESALTG